MKTVFKSDEVYHLWANRAHTHKIRNSAGNVSADCSQLYSYRECIGILTDTGAILSTYRWSVTTAKAQSLAARAVSGNVVYLPCKFPYDGNLVRLAENARSEGLSILKYIDRGNKARLINQAISAQYHDYLKLTDFAHNIDNLGMPVHVDNIADLRALRDGFLTQDNLSKCNVLAGRLQNKIAVIKEAIKHGFTKDIDSRLYDAQAMAGNVETVKAEFIKHGFVLPDFLDKLPAQAKKLLPALKKLNKEKEDEQTRIYAEKIALWRNSEYVNLPHALPPMLRIKKGLLDEGELGKDSIQTSWGASVPLSVAPFLWSMIVKAIETKTESDHSIEVGNYTLEKVFADGSIKVGCHVIAYSELEGIAKQLNYI